MIKDSFLIITAISSLTAAMCLFFKVADSMDNSGESVFHVWYILWFAASFILFLWEKGWLK